MFTAHTAYPQATLTSFFNKFSNQQQLFYIGTDERIHQIYYTPGPDIWSNQDMTAAANAPVLAAPGSGLTSFFNPYTNQQQIFYIGSDQQIYQIYYTQGPNTWSSQNMTAAANAPVLAATGSALTGFFNPFTNQEQMFYIGSDQQVYQIYYTPGPNTWSSQNMTAAANAPVLAATGSGLTSFFNPFTNQQQIFYIGSDQQVYQIYYTPGPNTWSDQDMTTAANAPTLAAHGSGLTSFFNGSSNQQQIFYIGTDQRVYQIYYTPTVNAWANQDMVAASNAPVLAEVYYTISGQVTAGGTGFSGVTVTLSGTTQAGISVSQSVTTNSNGNYSFNAPAAGNYTATPSYPDADYTFSPGSATFSNLASNQTANFSLATETNTETGTPVPQPPPAPAPPQIPPPVVSGSVTNCNDISGTWTDAYSDTFTFSQTGNALSGSTTNYNAACGNVQWTITGQMTGSGTYSLTEFNPSPAVDACGYLVQSGQTANVQITGCSTAQETYTGTGSGGSSFAGGGSGGSGSASTWTRASNPPGLQVSVDLLADKVSTSLTGQAKIGNLAITIQTASGQTQVLPSHSDALAGTSFNDSLQRTSLAPGQYGSVVATWDNISVTVPVSFYVIGNTRFSQYNFPYESQCPANPQPAWIVYKIDTAANGSCYYKAVLLGSKFISQTNVNGTGVSVANGILKSYAAGARRVCDPAPKGSENNTFFDVDTGGAPIAKITGTCNTVLSDGTNLPNPLVNNNPPAGSLATDPKNPIFACKDQILMIDPNDNSDLRSVQDTCPGCGGGSYGGTTWPGTIAHIDTFNSSQTCSPNDLGDYGNRVAIRLR